MNESACAAPGCGVDTSGEWCSTHDAWLEWLTDAHRPCGRHASPAERFWSRVDAEGDCWTWLAGRQGRGRYGSFVHRGHQIHQAHRWAYRYLVGPIDDNLVLDHLCKNRACVNPDHLEPVTQLENVRRGAAGAYKHRRTHCPLGHPYGGLNLVADRRRGWRSCRACNSEAQRRWRERQHASVA